MSSLPDRNFESFETDGSLEQFIIQVPTVPVSAEGQAVKDIFDAKPDVEGVVVMENARPAGLVMRTTFYQKIGSLYGHSLYMKRPVSILMETSMMTADVNDNISRIGIQAMSRDQSKLYDYIIAFKNKGYLGVISIRLFLVELSKRNEAQISVLKNQQIRLLSAHEQEILLRQDLEYQSASIRNLLDHADQGFLWFGKDLIVKKEYSYKCMDIFNKSVGGLYYPDLVSEYFGEEKTPVFQMAFESYFKNNSQVTDNVYLMLLPSDCVVLGKNIHFEYRRIESGGQKAVMVILNDITEKISMEKAMEDDRNKQRLIIKAFGYQAQIKQMLDEFHEIFAGGYQNFFSANGGFQDSLNELFRAVHTFKGDFAQYGFITASDRIHTFEDGLMELVNRGAGAGPSDVERIMAGADPDKILEDDLNVIYEVLGESYFDQSEIVSIPKEKLLGIAQRILDGGVPMEPAAVARLIRSISLKNVKVFLNQYRDYLQYLSGRVLKNMPVYIVEGDDVEIDGDVYGGFFKGLVHIYRNIMDHGLETDEERLEYGKSEQGLVECRITRGEDGWFTIRISDDGRGIDLGRLKAKAVERQLCTAEEVNRMTDEEAVGLIFSDHLSTKDVSDALSGRGMGMSAFREACLKLGGKVEIETKQGQGTAFVITLPCAE